MRNISPILLLFYPLLVSLILIGCKDKSVETNEEPDLNYPTIIHPLSEEKVLQLQHEFDLLNNNMICSKIDKYGFITRSSFDKKYNNIPISKDSAFALAVNTLLKNAKYDGVNDSISLISSGYNITQIDPTGSKWRIDFGPQVYKGFEIPNNVITVLIFGNEPYAISGHWYSNIYIPSNYRISILTAKAKVIGEKITWYDMSANPKEFIVSNESIGNEFTKAIFPVVKEGSINLSVTWKIPIKFFSNSIGWHIYLDVMTGEIIKIVQEFRT